MPKIFISYRRQDSSYETTMIYEFLRPKFGRENVFMDVDTIPAGVDFRQYLHEAVSGCDVLLAVIGEQWLVDRQGNRRLDDPRDFVRIEIEAALQRDIRVIPVLVRDATMPGPDELPETIKDLAFRNAVQVRAGRDLRVDIRRLIRDLEAVPRQTPRQSEASSAEVSSREPPPTRALSSRPPLPSGEIPRPPAKTVTPPARSPLPTAGQVITNYIGMKMVLIPAGEFMMGSPDSDPDARDNEKPQHLVRITRPFYLGVYPVTQAEYRRVMDINPGRFQERLGDANRPVEMVSWKHAQELCRKLSALPKEEAAGHVYRLPTEAEWEYSCRAGSTTRYSFGDSAESLGDYAWWHQKSDEGTHPVGEKRPNAWGLHDMHGNVWERCADWYGSDYYTQSPPSDPNGPPSGVTRVLRGGAFFSVDPGLFRCACRRDLLPRYRDLDIGIRVARTLNP